MLSQKVSVTPKRGNVLAAEQEHSGLKLSSEFLNHCHDCFAGRLRGAQERRRDAA